MSKHKPGKARMAELGRISGAKQLEKHGVEYFRELGAKGGRARKGLPNPRRVWRMCDRCAMQETLTWPGDVPLCLACREEIEREAADDKLLQNLDEIISRMDVPGTGGGCERPGITTSRGADADTSAAPFFQADEEWR